MLLPHKDRIPKEIANSSESDVVNIVEQIIK